MTSIRRFSGTRYDTGTIRDVVDALTVEAALHIKVNGVPYTTTMRTPGNDEALVRGLLFTEGIVSNPAADLSFRKIPDPESGLVACVEVGVAEADIERPVAGRRSQLSVSSCGVCGTRDPKDIEVYGPPLHIDEDDVLEIDAVEEMLKRMRAAQKTFSESGGSHGAAAFTTGADLLAVHEDVGRHNAVDKVVGSLLRDGHLDRAATLTISGRASYEIIYKAYRAAIPCVIAVSAPSSLAVETAERFGMTLAGFCRDGRLTMYSNRRSVTEKNAGSRTEDRDAPVQ